MARRPEDYAAMRAGARERIHAAAVSLFARHGPAATGIRDIAREAGVSTGLVYRHHTSKEDLFDDLVGQAADGLAATTARLRDGRPPAEAIEGFATDAVAAIAADTGFAEFVQLMNHAFAVPRPSARADELRARHTALLDALSELAAAGQAAGTVRPGPPRELAVSLLALLSGLATLRLALGPAMAFPGPEVVTGMLRPVRAGRRDGTAGQRGSESPR